MNQFVLYACTIASYGGFIFGYDIGISGGLTYMDSFLIKFFPSVHNKKIDVSTNQYCKFDNQLLSLFTSSLYLSGAVASFVAPIITRAFGRKWSMFVGGIAFLAGAAINGAAENVAMLITGRVFSGIGVGFANQSAPVYISEMAPHQVRAACSMLFQIMIAIGIFSANIINYGTNKINEGWRVSLGLAGVPALVLTIGSLILDDTPKSLIEHGKTEEAKQVLVKIRGTEDIHVEYEDLVVASQESQAIKYQWKNIVKRKYRAPLTLAILIPFFQQLTGIGGIMFYAPVLFNAIGFRDEASLSLPIIIFGANIFSTFVSIVMADKVLHTNLFSLGGKQMFLFQAFIGLLIYKILGTTGTAPSTITDVIGICASSIVMFVSLYLATFTWSWGILGWLVPSEIFTREIHIAGESINLSGNMLSSFIIGQVFFTMFCHMKFALFFFFTGCVIIMTIFVHFFLPETQNVPVEDMVLVWKQHWFWGKFINDDDVGRNHFENV